MVVVTHNLLGELGVVVGCGGDSGFMLNVKSMYKRGCTGTGKYLF